MRQSAGDQAHNWSVPKLMAGRTLVFNDAPATADKRSISPVIG
jgi:hypothetical protein